MNRNNILPYLVLFSAIMLAVSAAYFSITGLAKLFSGSAIAVIVMASVLELSKIITASFVHTFWSKLSIALKAYLTSGVIILSIITSIGIYGFLSNAYTITSGKLDKQNGEIKVFENKISMFEEQKSRYEEEMQRKNNRITQISNLRIQQESRIDSLYKKGLLSSAKGTEKTIKDSEAQINQINIDINEISKKINNLNDSINSIKIKIIDGENSDIASEIGPLKFISNITGFSMDSIVNFLILMFVFVFDPLAITLVIASNIAFDKKEINNKIENNNIQIELTKEQVDLDEEFTNKIDSDEQVEVLSEEISLDKEVTNKIDSDEQVEVLSEEKIELFDNSDEVVAEAEYLENQEIESIDSFSENINLDESKISEEEQNLDDIISNTLNSDLSKSIDKKNINKFKLFLGVLYKDGDLQVGDSIPPYSEFIKKLSEINIEFQPKEVKDFLILCNLMKIIYMDDNEKKILRDYEQAKKLLSIIYF